MIFIIHLDILLILFTACDARADFVFALDISHSIGRQGLKNPDPGLGDRNFGTVTQFVSDFVNRLNIGPDGSLAGVILFARDAEIHFSIQEHTNKAELTRAIEGIRYSDYDANYHLGTNTPGALDILRIDGQPGGALGLRDDTTKVAIVITDGRANLRVNDDTRTPEDDKEDARIAAEQLKASRIYDEVYAIGIQGQVDRNQGFSRRQLREISTCDNCYFNISAFRQDLFDDLREDFYRQFCTGK